MKTPSRGTAYVCGPLTEVAVEMQEGVKAFYCRIADVCQEVSGKRAYVPHEHSDPLKNVNLEPVEVDAVDRVQVCRRTTILIVVAVAPSWGGGIEVEMANQSDVPVVVLRQKGRRISRLLLGNPAVQLIIDYETEEEALFILRKALSAYQAKTPVMD